MPTLQEILNAQELLKSVPENRGPSCAIPRILKKEPLHNTEEAHRCCIFICNDSQSGPIYCDTIATHRCFIETGSFFVCDKHIKRI